VEECEHKRAATGFEGLAGSVGGGALNEASMDRRSFLGRIARWSGTLAVFGLGLQAVSGGSIMSSAVAAGATRNRQLHPWPSDDPFNMPIGMNAWYATTSDPATQDITSRGAAINTGAHSHPIYFPTASDPVHTITCSGGTGIESYITSENNQTAGARLFERLQTDVNPIPDPNVALWLNDRHLHIIPATSPNDLVENFVFVRDGGLDSGIAAATAKRVVRNRLDHYAHRAGSNPLRNRAGTRAWGGSAIAGLIRRHEVNPADPNYAGEIRIPHALAVMLRPPEQIGAAGQGSSSSPLFNTSTMFPANEIDAGGYPNSTGSCRMGMRFALDPTICTDAFIQANAPLLNGVPNPWQIALAKCLRDYGMIVCDQGSVTTFAAEPGLPSDIAYALTGTINPPWGRMSDWMMQYMRRVAGAGSVHNPGESHWNTWRTNGHGWGGGAPRVPYSPPLAPLSGDAPEPTPPGAPRDIEVTGTRTFDGTG
jgi:hypothetical protein